MAKLAEKKSKTIKMKEILKRLEAQAQEVSSTAKIYDNIYSAKHLGQAKKDRKRQKKRDLDALKPKVDEEIEESEDEVEESEVEESDESKEEKVEPTKLHEQGQAYDYIEKIAEMYSNKKPKNKDSDSEDQDTSAAANIGHDSRIQFINKCDAKNFETTK